MSIFSANTPAVIDGKPATLLFKLYRCHSVFICCLCNSALINLTPHVLHVNDAVSGLDPLGIKLMVVGLTKVGTAIWIYSKLNTSNISRVGKMMKILISIYVKCVQSVHFEMLVFQVSLIFFSSKIF